MDESRTEIVLDEIDRAKIELAFVRVREATKDVQHARELAHLDDLEKKKQDLEASLRGLANSLCEKYGVESTNQIAVDNLMTTPPRIIPPKGEPFIRAKEPALKAVDNG